MRSLVVAGLLVARGAAAQAPGDTPPAAAAPPQRVHLFDAYAISIAATSLPIIAGGMIGGEGNDRREWIGGSIALSGLLLGPSAGHGYIDSLLTTGLVLRVTGFVGCVALAAYDPHLEHPAVTIPALVTLGLTIQIGILWDFVTLPREVRRANRERALVPVISSRGLALAGTF